MLPNANDLQFFLEVAKTGSMSRAAERLGVSQPALSQAMKRLETNFENQLLLRSKSGVVLTKAGEKLSQKARLLLEAWQDIKDESQRDEQQVRGVYSLGVHSSVALYNLPFVAPQLLRDFPHLELKLEHDLSRKITEQVISFKLDFAIVVNPVSHPDLVIKELFGDEVAFYHAKKIKEENQAVLISEPDLRQTQELLNQLPQKKMTFKRRVTSSNLEVIKSLVISGAGVGIVPGRVIGVDLKKVEKISGMPTFKDRICLVYRHDVQRSLAARSLSQFFLTHLKGLGS
jgi:DNA-binding transcriptional LysR family regulator